jgi:hypothetical protein
MRRRTCSATPRGSRGLLERTGGRRYITSRHVHPRCIGIAQIAAAALALLMTALAGLAGEARARGHPPLSREQARYLRLTQRGISDVRRHWWNTSYHWYDDDLNPKRFPPLATIWSIVNLFEALDGVAMAQPTAANRGAIDLFARKADRYWDPEMNAFAPYPGDRGKDRVYFDDNAWWGLAFLDAYRATRNPHYLANAMRAMRFIDAEGWVRPGGGFLWDTRKSPHNNPTEEGMVTYGGATALAAALYENTGRSKYRKMAHRYIAWGDRNASSRGLHRTPQRGPMTDVEGPVIGAHLSLCRMGDRHECRRAWTLGAATFRWWQPRKLNRRYYDPAADAILFRYVLQLAVDTHRPADPQFTGPDRMALYGWARRAARDALKHARVNGLFMKFWDGSKAARHRDQYRHFHHGLVQVQVSPLAVFAWLAATPVPSG